MARTKVTHYFDYKSPYAYLAQEETGRVLHEARTAHQWRRVRYAYLDCRREATRRGLIIKGPRKIFDSSIAHIGMLYAKRQGDFRPYHRVVYERFWKRELDIENPLVVQQVLAEMGVDASGFLAYLPSEGRREHDRIRAEAEAQGVFGVPSYLVNGELFWGNERIERVRERLATRAYEPFPG